MSEQTRATTVVVPFEITGWDAHPYGEGAEGAELARIAVAKRFTGALDATSEAIVLTARGEGGAGYVASERVTGTLAGRSGTFVLQHGGVGDADGQHAFGHVVPGTGTGELAGLRGEAVYAHDDEGARVTLTYTL